MAQPLIAIVGPTAVGKSALALLLAQSFRGEIVNADSRLVYRGLDIGTAKPTAEERCNVPHHLIDIRKPDEAFSLAGFLVLASHAIRDIHRQGRVPFLVGGTGLYIWGLLEGLRAPQVPPNPELRQRLLRRAEVEGPLALFQELQRVDPDGAARMDYRNVRRTVRALEVYEATGVPFSELGLRQPPPYIPLVLGLTLSRQELYRRIDERVEEMLRVGWLKEVQRLLEGGYSADLPSLSSVGYRELAAHLQGRLSLEEAIRRIKTATHRFARHQEGWFRLADARIRWLSATADAPGEAERLVAAFLEG